MALRAHSSKMWPSKCRSGIPGATPVWSMGATYPHQLQAVRRLCPDMVILAPGVGAQGGDLENTVKYGVNADGEGLIINSSRGIIYASKNQSDFDKEARRAADDLRQAINVIRGEVANSPQLPITVTEAREALA